MVGGGTLLSEVFAAVRIPAVKTGPHTVRLLSRWKATPGVLGLVGPTPPKTCFQKLLVMRKEYD